MFDSLIKSSTSSVFTSMSTLLAVKAFKSVIDSFKRSSTSSIFNTISLADNETEISEALAK